MACEWGHAFARIHSLLMHADGSERPPCRKAIYGNCQVAMRVPDSAHLKPTIMPNYDYQCEKCGHDFEVFQSMNDAKLTCCPLDDCDGAVKRLLGTGAGLIFKGAGFYQTDHRSASYKAGAKSDTPGGGESKGGDPAAAKPAKESKPAAAKPDKS